MKKIILLFSLFFFFLSIGYCEEIVEYSGSAILIEASTGKILYEKEADIEKAPASMTKIMSMALIMDAIKDGKITLEDNVVISEKAASMGGSQVYLNTGEKYKVKELLKSIAVASANELVVSIKQSHISKEEIIV